MFQTDSGIASLETQALASRHPAIQRCLDAWLRAYKEERARGKDDLSSRWAASECYRAAMPELTSHASIRDFIACTAHGILIDAIEEKAASKLLYAAQVAVGALRHEPAPPKVEAA
jgi:hypothetical protein